MLKKAGAVTIAAAALTMLGSPAFAHPWYDPDDYFPGSDEDVWVNEEAEQNDQTGVLNFADDSDVLSQINVCQIEVNVIGIPILSQNDSLSSCVTTDDDGGSSNDDSHHDDDDDNGWDDDK